jgi:hypothetical protein
MNANINTAIIATVKAGVTASIILQPVFIYQYLKTLFICAVP